MNRILLLLPLALLSGCSILPPGQCESGTWALNVGPFFSQSAKLSGVVKQSDGTFKIQDFDGMTSYLGVFNTRQTAHDLVLEPKQVPPSTVPASIAAPAK